MSVGISHMGASAGRSKVCCISHCKHEVYLLVDFILFVEYFPSLALCRILQALHLLLFGSHTRSPHLPCLLVVTTRKDQLISIPNDLFFPEFLLPDEG